jgi:CubicO group peptidase (beta-lactamase class C family)
MANFVTMKAKTDTGELHGFYHPQFESIAHEFERNFRERGEVGASVSLTLEGETVVDLWGGAARLPEGMPWQEDTVSIVFSCTKGATALCAHILAARGQLDLDAPVAHYWPEFGQNGKENIPVRMLLNHQCGLPAVRKPLPPGAFYDWNTVVEALAEETPFWTPGTAQGYGMVTFGWLVGEVVRRISGKSLGTFFREEVAQPLGLDFWIGLPEEHENRTARMIPAPLPGENDPVSPFNARMVDPTSIQFLSLMNTGGYLLPDATGTMSYDNRQAHAAEIGGAGGITNARGLARMYAPLANGGKLGNVELVDADTLARMSAVSAATNTDQTLLVATRYALGFFKTIDNRRHGIGMQDSALLSEEAFGHPGAGGSLGFADPAARLSFGYTMNKMGQGVLLNERGQSLVDAAYHSLGYRSNASGRWIK